MQVSFHQHQNYVTITITPEDDDQLIHGRASLDRTHASFEMPKDFRLSEAHPDLLGLAALIVSSPWVGKRLELPFAVSEEFAYNSQLFFKVEIVNSSPTISPRNTGTRPGLAFSAGVDSMASLELMPENTVPVFSHRAPLFGVRKGLYNDDAPLHAITEMQKAGREVYKVTNDLEHMRKPVGFSVDPSPSVPLILLADYFSLDSIAFGTIAEAAYRTGSDRFMDYADRPIFVKWQSVFQAAGISYFNLVAPISEMGTMRISRKSKFGYLAQSCVRGVAGNPCGLCVKCFRKSLTEAYLTGEWPSSDRIKKMMSQRAVQNYLSTQPIRLEIILMEVLSKYDGDDSLLNALKERVSTSLMDTSFTHAWYEPGMKAMVPEKYYDAIVESLNRFIPKMTSEQEQAFEMFDIRPSIEAAQESGLMDKWNAQLETALLE